MEDKYQLAQKWIREAGQFLRQHLHDEMAIEEKTSFSDVVTNLDKEVESCLTQEILSHYPEDRVFGEEGEDRPSLSKEKVWFIDPIDGTTNFIVQKTDFAILMAYFEDGVGQFGLIYDVMKDQLYHGGGAFPACLDGEALPAAPEKPLSMGMIGINPGLYAQNPAGITDLAKSMMGSRCIGSAGLSFAYLLTQRYMAYVSYVYPWDYAAGMVLGEALGYTLITLTGDRPSLQEREYVLMVPTNKLPEVKGYLTHELS